MPNSTIDLILAKQFFSIVVKSGDLEYARHIYNKLVHEYKYNGSYSHLNENDRKNIADVYNRMIYVEANSLRFQEAVEILLEIETLLPDVVTDITYIPFIARFGNSPELLNETTVMFNRMRKFGIKPTSSAYYYLLDAYSNHPFETEKILQILLEMINEKVPLSQRCQYSLRKIIASATSKEHYVQFVKTHIDKIDPSYVSFMNSL